MQYSKVEICGVNTSKLKVLTEKEKKRLLEIMNTGTEKEKKKAREQMINGNLRLVLSVIQRFVNRGENLDDLFQVGVIGLIKAIDNFDNTLNVRFSTYGVPIVYGSPEERVVLYLWECQLSGHYILRLTLLNSSLRPKKIRKHKKFWRI